MQVERVHSHREIASSHWMGYSTNWLSLLWCLATIWQTLTVSTYSQPTSPEGQLCRQSSRSYEDVIEQLFELIQEMVGLTPSRLKSPRSLCWIWEYRHPFMLNLELFSARDVMEPGIRVLHLKENVASLAWLLASTSHGGFPVVCRPKPDHAEVFQGTIKRLELCMLLENEHIFEPEINNESLSSPHPLSYEKIRVEKLPNLSCLTMLLNHYTTDPWYQQLFINLEPYINKSAMSVQAHFSLQHTYTVFCTLGLCHLTAVDPQNQVVGVITRKDLMPFPLEERLRLQLEPQSPDAVEQPLDSRPWMCS